MYGKCLRGKDCLFAHGNDELRKPFEELEDKFDEHMSEDEFEELMAEDEFNLIPLKKNKTKKCRYYHLHGECLHGDKCYFAHSSNILSDANGFQP